MPDEDKEDYQNFHKEAKNVYNESKGKVKVYQAVKKVKRPPNPYILFYRDRIQTYQKELQIGGEKKRESKEIQRALQN